MTDLIYDECKKKQSSEICGCLHENIINDKGISSCMDCGEVVEQYMSETDKEWLSHGYQDVKQNLDYTRIQIRKAEGKGILKDLENVGIPENIRTHANKIYLEITENNKILRGKSRKAAIFACVSYSYILEGDPQPPDELMKMFGVEKRCALRGLKELSANIKQDSKIRKMFHPKINLISNTMKIFKAGEKQIEEVEEIYKKIHNKSTTLNRSRPQSLASGVVYYWILKNKKNITLKEFADKVGISSLTIQNTFTEIDRILQKAK